MEPSYIAVWLRKPVPALAERKPIDKPDRTESCSLGRQVKRRGWHERSDPVVG